MKVRSVRFATMALAVGLIAVIRAAAQTPSTPIWQGVYTAAQAERGKATYKEACIRCHGGDLRGTTAPALAGDRFMETWGGDSVKLLFEKIRDTMPPNFGTVLNDEQKIEIVAYILESNGYPAGRQTLDAAGDLASMLILRQGEQVTVQNFSLVRTIGCLTRDANRWVLRNASDPAVTTEASPAADGKDQAADAPLGAARFELLSAQPFDPASRQGDKVEARGLIYRDGADELLTLTSLQSVGTCS